MARSSSEIEGSDGRTLEENHHLPAPLQHPESSSMPLAAISGVTPESLPVGEYPTFLSVLAISGV